MYSTADEIMYDLTHACLSNFFFYLFPYLLFAHIGFAFSLIY